jgi:MFS family permease
MRLSGDDFRLVFWIALIPAYLSILVLLIAVREIPWSSGAEDKRRPMSRADLAGLSATFWWIIGIAGLLALARFSQAFVVLKAHDVGIDPAFVPLMLVVVHLFHSVAGYPFGILADSMDRRVLLGIGALILIGADLILAGAATIWWTTAGAALWGLQLAVTQGLLGAMIADTAPSRLRGTAFGIYDVAIGFATLAASAGAGVLWTAAGPAAAFGASAAIATAAGLMLLLRPLPKRTQAAS